MKDHIGPSLPYPSAVIDHASWHGHAPAEGGVSPSHWKSEMILQTDERLVELSAIPTARLDTAPSQLDDLPLVYGLVAKVLLPRPAFNFKVEHDLPPNVTLLEAKPRATVVGEHLIWNFGRLDPGQELRLQVVVLPDKGTVPPAGELTNFNATYTQNLYFQTPLVRTKLSVKISGPESVRVGEIAEYVIETKNVGNWVSEHVTAAVLVPPELLGPDGVSPNFTIGNLDPGASRKLTLFAKGTTSGSALFRVKISGSADSHSEDEFVTTVVN